MIAARRPSLLAIAAIVIIPTVQAQVSGNASNNAESTRMLGQGPVMPLPALVAAAEAEAGQTSSPEPVPANATDPTIPTSAPPTSLTPLQTDATISAAVTPSLPKKKTRKSRKLQKTTIKKYRKARKLSDQVKELMGLLRPATEEDSKDDAEPSNPVYKKITDDPKDQSSSSDGPTARPPVKYVTPINCALWPNCGSPMVPWYMSASSNGAVSRSERRQIINSFNSANNTTRSQSQCGGNGDIKCGGTDGQMCPSGCRCTSGVKGGMGSGSALQLMTTSGGAQGFCTPDIQKSIRSRQ